MHHWSSNAILVYLCTSCDIISSKIMPPHGRACHQLYCVKIWSQSNWQFKRYWQFCTPPVAVQTHCQNVNLLVSINRYATHGLPGASSCTTPYIQLGCQWPDVTVLPIQVAAWDLDSNSQDQGWGKTWLSTLHPGQRGLCYHGQMGTSRWSAQEWPQEVLRLHRKHIRWQDLPTSPCLQAGRHHKEVWQIHQLASRLDMPNHLQSINQWWQWCCNRIWSSMQADLGNPRCQHWAAQTTSEGQPWQEGITSTRDLQNILCCLIRSSCNVCRTCRTCCMPHPPDTWS